MSPGNLRSISLAAAESILLLGLLALSALVLRGSIAADRVSNLGPWELTAALLACIAIYWTMQTLGRNQTAFWFAALLVFLAQGPAIWTHNALEWSQFFGIEAVGGSGRSVVRDTILFLVSLVGLITLYRTIGLRKLDSLLLSRQVKASDRNKILLNETLTLLGLMTCGILLAFFIVLTASSLAKHQNLVSLTPWSVITVGGGGAILLVSSLIVWLTRR